MKKSFAAMFVATMMMFAACEKDDNQTTAPEQQEPATLVGTTWTHVEENDYIGEDDQMHHYKETEYVKFLTSTTGQMGNKYEEPEFPEENTEESLQFSYTYNAPKGSITVTDDGETMTASFVVEGNKLTMTLSEDYYPLVFYKN